MPLLFTFSMSTTVISKIKIFLWQTWENDKKTVIAVSVYDILDRPFGAFSKIGSNSIPY